MDFILRIVDTVTDFQISFLCSIFFINSMKYLLGIMTVGVHAKPPEKTMGRSVKWHCGGIIIHGGISLECY